MGNLIVGSILLVVLFLAGRSIYRDHKAGKFICGGDCAGCGGRCHTSYSPKKNS